MFLVGGFQLYVAQLFSVKDFFLMFRSFAHFRMTGSLSRATLTVEKIIVFFANTEQVFVMVES